MQLSLLKLFKSSGESNPNLSHGKLESYYQLG